MASKEIPLVECDGYDCDEVEFGSTSELEDLLRFCMSRGWYIANGTDLCPRCNDERG